MTEHTRKWLLKLPEYIRQNVRVVWTHPHVDCDNILSVLEYGRLLGVRASDLILKFVSSGFTECPDGVVLLDIDIGLKGEPSCYAELIKLEEDSETRAALESIAKYVDWHDNGEVICAPAYQQVGTLRNLIKGMREQGKSDIDIIYAMEPLYDAMLAAERKRLQIVCEFSSAKRFADGKIVLIRTDSLTLAKVIAAQEGVLVLAYEITGGTDDEIRSCGLLLHPSEKNVHLGELLAESLGSEFLNRPDALVGKRYVVWGGNKRPPSEKCPYSIEEIVDMLVGKLS